MYPPKNISRLLFVLLFPSLPVLNAQINVASTAKGGSIELLSGTMNPKEPVSRMIDENEKSRGVFFPPDSAEFRIRFFKPMDITRLSILKGSLEKIQSIKDIVVKTSSGKEIPFTFPKEGYNPKDRGAAPVYAEIDVNDTCEYIDILVRSVYPDGAAYTCIYEVKAETNEDIGNLFEVDYNAEKPHYIMRTKYEPEAVDESTIDPGTITNGKPRMLGPDVFPKTIFSPDDIAFYQEQIKNDKFAKMAYEELLATCDGYLTKKVKIPVPDKNTADDTGTHTKYSEWIGNLAFAYVLGDRQKPEYAKKAIELMDYYAENYAAYGPTKHPKFNHDTAKLTWQRLSEAMWGISVALAYDLLKSDPSVFPKEKADSIMANLLVPLAEELKRGSGTVMDPGTNWSAYPGVYVLMVGRLSGNEDYVKLGKYGSTGAPVESSSKTKGGKKVNKLPGLINKIRGGIDPQGNWIEPSPGYANMAAASLITGARVAWNMGEDWFAIGGGNLRRIRESVLNRATAANTIPGTEDSKEGAIGEDYYTTLNEHLVRIYKDNEGLKNLLSVRKNFTLKIRFQTILPSIDFGQYHAAEAKPQESIYLPSLGYTIARQNYQNHPMYFMLDASIETSHGHPDKLQIILHAHDKMVLPDPGSIWYANDTYLSWYKRTGTHNTVSINESNMSMEAPVLEIFASGDRMHLARATAPEAYPGTILTRSTLQLDTLLLDVFHVDTKINADIDYNLHFRGGELVEAPEGTAGEFFTKDPMKQLTDQKRLAVGENARFRWDYGDDRFVQYQTVTADTEVFTGQGIDPTDNPDDYVILRRRQGGDFFSAIDATVGPSRVKSLEVIPTKNQNFFEGKVNYTDGNTGYVLVNYSSDMTQTVEGAGSRLRGAYAYLEVNADQELIKAVYAGEGGTVEKDGVAKLTVSGPAVLLIDQFSEDRFTVRNMNNRGEAKVTATVKMPFKESYAIFPTDAEGKRTGEKRSLKYLAATGEWEIAVDGANRQEITDNPKGAYEIEEEERQAAIKARLAQEKAIKTARFAELEKLYQESDGKTAENEVIVVHAEDFSSQTNGEAKINTGRPGGLASPSGIKGESIIGWVGEGHRLDWEVDVKKSGYYAMSLKYCSQEEPVRAIKVDGKFPAEFFSAVRFDTTGGWSRDSDNWEVATITDPTFGTPWLIYLEEGKHTISMENVELGLNLDYLVLHDPGLAATRAVFEEQKKNKVQIPSMAELKNMYLE